MLYQRKIGLALLTLTLSVSALATPKRLDLKKLLAQPQPARQEFVPARAGWDGPEQSTVSAAYFQQLATRNSAEQTKAMFLQLLVPDWRLLAVVLAAILILRYFRRATPEEQEASYSQSPAEVPRAA